MGLGRRFARVDHQCAVDGVMKSPRRRVPQPGQDCGRGPEGPRPQGCLEGVQQLPPPDWPTWLQVELKMLLMTPPKANTTTTISAAMPAISRPYSTADAPRSSILAF